MAEPCCSWDHDRDGNCPKHPHGIKLKLEINTLVVVHESFGAQVVIDKGEGDMTVMIHNGRYIYVSRDHIRVMTKLEERLWLRK